MNEDYKLRNDIRHEYLKRRNEMSEDIRDRKSGIIIDKLKNLECYQNAQNILVYVSYKSEVSTLPLINELLTNHDKKLFCPKVQGDDIFFYQVESLDELQKGYQGITEPLEMENRVYQKGLNHKSLVITPGSVFDSMGNRMGYGKGFYDRFFEKTDPIVKIGVCFEEQMYYNFLPRLNHDVLMDYIITDERQITIHE